MKSWGRSNLFHAIVVVGAGLVGACSKAPPTGSDGSQDGAAEQTDTPMESVSIDVTLPIDGTPFEATAGDAICWCSPDGGPSCQICPCDCFKVPDGGACFPCYV